MKEPLAGAVIQGTGGLRMLRFKDQHRGKGKRGGIRVIYYWWLAGSQFCLFTLYDKDVADDLNMDQKNALARLLKWELIARREDET